MKKIAILLLFALPIALLSCKQDDAYKAKAENPEFIHAGVRRTIDIIRHDIFAPPIASRIFAYTSVAAYEALVPGYPNYKTMAGKLNGLNPCPQPEAGKEYCYPLASANAQLITARALIFSEEKIDELLAEVTKQYKEMGVPQDVFDRSMAYGEAVAKHVIAWSKTDNYAQTRSASKFTINTKDPGRWRPTPPAYADGLEPHWAEIRPWVLDSAGQIDSEPPLSFSKEKDSPFYKQVMVVYETVKNLTPEQEATAWYWDDNPFAMEVSGHLAFGKKKISPGGHWMNIASIVCRKSGSDVIQSAETYVIVACAIADGFITSWNAKYKYNVIRPESYINEYIDADWFPLIQTPPFPEHTSGHSTVSAAAAGVLTARFGENYAFTDSTEVEFGIPARSFNSFKEAADQAGISRIYGGIHYEQGNKAGGKNGWAVGEYVYRKLSAK